MAPKLASHLTKLGVLLLLGGLWWWARQQQDLVLQGLALMLLGAAVLSGWAVLLGRLALKRALAEAEHPKRIEVLAGLSCRSGFRLPLPAWLPLVSVSWTTNGQPASWRRNRELSEYLCFPRRALQQQVVREFAVRDILGLFCWTTCWTQNARLRILPAVDSGSVVVPLVGMVAGSDTPDPYSAESGERLDMRRYRKGDPLRLVLWSVYQRSGQVMVRAPERALSAHQKVGLYLLCSSTDAPAAALARVLLETGTLGPGWRFGADGCSPWAQDLSLALDSLAGSGQALENGGEVRILSFLEDLARDSFGTCLVLLSHDPETRNRHLALVNQAVDLPRLSLEIWVVCEQGQIPARTSFPRLVGGRLRLVEKTEKRFEMRTF